MSPFWKNVNDELQYQSMNLKTLSFLTGVPYTTITNGRNRADSIPTADVALKIAKVLNKPLEWLLGESAALPKTDDDVNETATAVLLEQNELMLYRKYERLIAALERLSVRAQEAFADMAAALSTD